MKGNGILALAVLAALVVSGQVTLLDFRSDCIPCDLQDKVIKRVEAKYAGRVAVVYVDAEREPERAAEFNIKTLPTVIIYDAGGEAAFRADGGYTKQNALDKILAKLLEYGRLANWRL